MVSFHMATTTMGDLLLGQVVQISFLGIQLNLVGSGCGAPAILVSIFLHPFHPLPSHPQCLWQRQSVFILHHDKISCLLTDYPFCGIWWLSSCQLLYPVLPSSVTCSSPVQANVHSHSEGRCIKDNIF